MFSNMLNSIPGVGHVKGLLHYAAGDKLGGDKAMYEATRTTSVVAGATVGIVGGPAGMVAGGVAGGMLLDATASAIAGEPLGVVAGAHDIVTDVADGRVPIGAVARTTILVAGDSLTAVGAGGIVNSVTKSVGESTGKSLVTEVAKGVLKAESKAVMSATAGTYVQGIASMDRGSDNYRHPRPSGSSSTSSSASTSNTANTRNSGTTNTGSSGSTNTGNSGTTNSKSGSGSSNTGRSNSSGTGSSQNQSSGASGSQPPQDNKPKDIKKQNEQPETYWSAFLKIFGADSLENVCFGTPRRWPFKGIERSKKTLRKLVKALKDAGLLEIVVKITVIILENIDPKHATALNFISIAKFVDAYVRERITERNESRTDDSDTREFWAEAIQDILKNLTEFASKALSVFKETWTNISEFSCDPDFRDVFTAIYHYIKHKIVPDKGIVLSMKEYFELITSLLETLKGLKVYKDLGAGRLEIVFERFYDKFGRRFKIVVKYENGALVLSTGYVVTDSVDGDADGDEFVDYEKIDKTTK